MQPANQPAAPALPEGFDPALGELLERLKLTVHVEAFAREGLTSLVIAKELTDAQLKELGISRMGDRIALLKALQEAAGKGVGLSVTPAAAVPAATEGTPRKRRQSAGFKQTPMKKASSEGILQYQIIAPKNHEELQEQLGIIILDKAAIGDAMQKLPKSLQALLQKLVQSSTMPLSKLAATFNCTEAQVTAMKQNLMNRLDKIRQSEIDGKPRKERVYHTAFDLFVELIMEQHFAVDFDSSLAYKGSPGQKRSKVLIPDAGIGLRYST